MFPPTPTLPHKGGREKGVRCCTDPLFLPSAPLILRRPKAVSKGEGERVPDVVLGERVYQSVHLPGLRAGVFGNEVPDQIRDGTVGT